MMLNKEFKSDQLMNALVKATAEAGHQLSYEECKNNPDLPEPNAFAYFWQSYEQAAQAAWRKVNLGGKSVNGVKFNAATLKALQKK